jgi:hypothetical protein
MEIVEICGCSYQLVTFCRRQLNLPDVHQTQQQMLSRLQLEVQELRREVMRFLNLETFHDNTDVITAGDVTTRTTDSCATLCITAGRRAGSKISTRIDRSEMWSSR